MNPKFLLASLGLAAALLSCSRKEDIQPVSTTVSSSAQVQVINGRLVFADQQALDKVRAELRDITSKAGGDELLAAWENKLSFSSLRASAIKEEANLETLQSKGQATPAYSLMTSFGFPSFLAATLNADGEYQVGNKIYVFRDGYKYLASSEEELLAIKSNPTVGKLRFRAGLNVLNKAKATTGKYMGVGTNRVSETSNPYSDNKYNNYYFNLNNDSNSHRRIIYDIHIYSEDDGPTPAAGDYENYYSVLYLQIKYEYQNSKGNWYPASGQNFTWQTQISYDATASYPYYQVSSSNTRSTSLYQSGTYDNGIVMLTLADSHLSATTVAPPNPGSITWNFEINGTLQGYPVNDSAHNYTVSGSPLW